MKKMYLTLWFSDLLVLDPDLEKYLGGVYVKGKGQITKHNLSKILEHITLNPPKDYEFFGMANDCFCFKKID